MKKYFLITMICVATIVTKAQPPAPPSNAGGPPPPAKGRAMTPPEEQLQLVATFQGKVVKMNANNDYVYDGFYMLSKGDSLLVKFPPHLGAQITNALKIGSAVSLSGVQNIAPMGEKEIRMLSITSGANTITDTSAPAPTPPRETYVSGNGKITLLQTNREGIVDGLIVDNKTILRIPPHIAMQLSTIAQKDAGIAYSGMKRLPNKGEILASDYTIVHCGTITVNGQQFLLQ